MELTVQVGCLATILLLWQPCHTCDRDDFQGQVRIDRIKDADIVLYGQIHENYAERVEPEQLDFYLKFTKYCVLRNAIVDPDLTALLQNIDLVIKDVYVYQDCVKEWHLLNDNVNKFAILTLEYDSLGNQLILEQINDESGVHIIEQNNYLVDEINTLAEETAEAENERDRFKSLSSYECSGIGLTAIKTTPRALLVSGKSVQEHSVFIIVLLLSLLTLWYNTSFWSKL